MSQQEICRRCNAIDSIITDYLIGEQLCNNCGLVYEERIIVDQDEQRHFQNDNGDNQLHRLSAPIKPTDSYELGTNFMIKENGKTKIYINNSNKTKNQNNFLKIQKLLSEASVHQNVIEEVKRIYDNLAKNKNFGKKITNKAIIGIYFYACRKLKIAKTIKEISVMFNIKERIIKKVFNSIKFDIVETAIDEDELLDTQCNYIRSFIDDNQLNSTLKELPYNIAKNINEGSFLEGKCPKTVAGLALILSCKIINEKIDDKNEFYKKFSNKNSLKQSFQQIKNLLNKIIPQEYADKIELLLKDDIPKKSLL